MRERLPLNHLKSNSSCVQRGWTASIGHPSRSKAKLPSLALSISVKTWGAYTMPFTVETVHWYIIVVCSCRGALFFSGPCQTMWRKGNTEQLGLRHCSQFNYRIRLSGGRTWKNKETCHWTEWIYQETHNLMSPCAMKAKKILLKENICSVFGRKGWKAGPVLRTWPLQPASLKKSRYATIEYSGGLKNVAMFVPAAV